MFELGKGHEVWSGTAFKLSMASRKGVGHWAVYERDMRPSYPRVKSSNLLCQISRLVKVFKTRVWQDRICILEKYVYTAMPLNSHTSHPQASDRKEGYKTIIKGREYDKLKRNQMPELKQRATLELHLAREVRLLKFLRETGNVDFYVKLFDFSIYTSDSKRCFKQKK